jgi:diaminohydroxyphosphoribosylaminopyrimidine deaminase/5-amino-6-(5-phosphoribosylamino)uracil reductase
VAVTDRAPADRREVLAATGCEVLAMPGSGPVPIVPLLEELGRRGVTNLLVEGGGRTLGSFLDAGQVDAVDVFIAPTLEGGEPAFTPARGAGHPRMADALRLERSEASLIDGDVRIRGTFPPSWRPAE